MADSTISALADAGALHSGDKFVIERGAASNKSKSLLGYPELIYRYTITGSDKASIDTGVDTADAGTNDWTNGDLLEVWITTRTDDTAALVGISVTLNNDAGANYDRQNFRARNATVSGGPSLAQANWALVSHGSGGSASYPSTHRITIPDFAGTTFFKSAECTSGAVDGTAANNNMEVNALGYRSTSAITRLAVAAGSGQKLKVGSQLLIYKRLAA